ncbi:hypothetical protein Leryth_006505, partial [Lithospermum erythrorhizon]
IFDGEFNQVVFNTKKFPNSNKSRIQASLDLLHIFNTFDFSDLYHLGEAAASTLVCANVGLRSDYSCTRATY